MPCYILQAGDTPNTPWRPIAEASKERGSTIWAALRHDLSTFTRRPDLQHWDGLQVPLRHPGIGQDGFDLGWVIAAPVGWGGFPDEWIAGWLPMPKHPDAPQQPQEAA